MDSFAPLWLFLDRADLETERRQCRDEGRDLGPLEAEFDRLAAADLTDPARQAEAAALLDRAAALPIRPDYPYDEPSDLDAIRAARPARRPLAGSPPPRLDDTELRDRLHGAWLGRVCGCLLGKPVEGWRRERIEGYLRETGRFPLAGYFRLDAPEEVRRRYGVTPERPFLETVREMPEDDDLNYTVAALALMRRHGPEFRPIDVATFWLTELPILRTCTAERVAYRNLCLLVPPPDSARRRNPYREWIGAQIRADFWGYVSPGDPERAAALAWKDACVSHVRNGIYGAMWAAAMIASAFSLSEPRAIIEAGLGEIPERSRLAEALRGVLEWHAAGMAYEEAVAALHAAWDERRPHDWCHTISNAMLVALALLWGEGRFGETLCRAVQPGFDTDCNGATAGSVVGALLGAAALPEAWTAPFRDTLLTGLSGYGRVRISELAEETFQLARASG